MFERRIRTGIVASKSILSKSIFLMYIKNIRIVKKQGGNFMKNGSLKAGLIIMIMSMLVLVAACGQSEGGTQTSGDGEKEKLKIVTDAAYAPFESLDKDEIVGFDVDFLEKVMEEAGYEYELVNVGWDPLFVEIQDELSDAAISAITINEERKETYDFSVSYFESTNMILVPEDSDIQSAEDLKGKVVAVQNGTTGQEAAEAILGENNKNIKKFENNNLAIMELTKNGADAVVADNTVVLEYVKNNPDQGFKTIKDEENFDKEYYGLMLPKGSELKADLDEAIKAVLENGQYSEVYQEWFGEEPNVDSLGKDE
jgi:glutamine transport system substrate-binding protein